MKKSIRQFLFGTLLNDNKAANIGWLLFRLHIGLSMAIHAGLPKMKDIAAPGWFNEQVAELGFTFPSPAFWATTASWGEFVGGICIAMGLLTRFNAMQLTFQFFVVSFLWYDKPEPITGMYFQNTLFMAFVLITFFGGGRYSLDKLILKRGKLIINNSSKMIVASLLLLIGSGSYAQKGPLKGSGKIVTKTFDYNGFTKIELQDLDGKIEIETGKSFTISASIDDNLQSLLSASVKNGELKIELSGNTNNKMYIEETGIYIKISMPSISFIKHRGNGVVYVNEVDEKQLEIVNGGNGNIIATGKVEELRISCSGNGTVRAEKLMAKTVAVKRSGNGNVYINTENSFTANSSGNGNVINKGNGMADAASVATGNSYIMDAASKQKEVPALPAEEHNKPKSRIKNNTDQTMELKVVYPVKGSYGITIKPGQTRREYFPLGTKIYQEGKMKEALFEITAASREKVLVIE